MRDELIELLDLGDLVTKPVRNLSLGERMKAEIFGALLHRPSVLFLDEPTIGLDVTAQKRIRAFIAEYNRRTGATVLLTSHYMADVQALCKRVIVIHHGRILFDGALAALADQFAATKTINVTLLDGAPDLSKYGEVLGSDDGRTTIRVKRADAPRVTTKMLRELHIADLTIEDPPIEDVIEHVFATPADRRERAARRRRCRGGRCAARGVPVTGGHPAGTGAVTAAELSASAEPLEPTSRPSISPRPPAHGSTCTRRRCGSRSRSSSSTESRTTST